MDIQTVLIDALLPVISSALGAIAATLLPKLFNAKYYKIALQVLPLVDAILADNTKIYGTSGVRIILQETIKAVADDQLSPEEISKVLSLVLKLFNPAQAASALPDADAQKVMEAIANTPNILDLDLSKLRLS